LQQEHKERLDRIRKRLQLTYSKEGNAKKDKQVVVTNLLPKARKRAKVESSYPYSVII
jgi:hypothetical protein